MKRTLIRLFGALLTASLLIAGGLSAVVIKQGYDLYRAALDAQPVADMAAEIRGKENFSTLDQLPQIYLDAVISVEDQRYYTHPGVDPLAILRAAFNDIRTLSFAEGGSTITQQLAKNEYFTQEKKLTRKVAEVFMALELERQLSKDEILELYLNSINFGSGYYCVADASQGYFGKPPAQMTDWEATILAGIPNAPSAYSLDRSPQLARQRQQRVLERMVACKKLTAAEADRILDENRLEYEEKIYFVNTIRPEEKRKRYAAA